MTAERIEQREARNLVLAPGEYVFVQDVKEGGIRTLVGPTVFSPTGEDQPVLYKMKGHKPFIPVKLSDATQKAAIAVEGYYLVLLNPAEDHSHPRGGRGEPTPELSVGRKINIPGPTMFPLWPGQSVQMIKGHHLRSNQYLLVRIYNEEEAKANWADAIIKPATDSESEDILITGDAPADLAVGKMYIIKGTDVSFYIPPTGVSVVADHNITRGEQVGDGYVREALTLERLEYSILVNENGSKRYERGPKVVFPEPTELFIRGKKGEKKFRAVELSEIQGIYVKVIASYIDEQGNERKQGDELFITGKDTPIYYPREEHSLVKYDSNTKHFATAIPGGEGRYQMDRLSGHIDTIRGPAMLLPDPRTKVIVRRVLTGKECALWYPGNEEAQQYNAAMRALLGQAPTTRSGALSEGQVTRSKVKAKSKGGEEKSRGIAVNALDSGGMEMSMYASANSAVIADEFSRASTYTQPRTVTLDTKYQGVPIINVWTGYAVMVVSNSSGERRVVEGPKRVLLNYDETLEVLSLSTGRPKHTGRLLKTVYLRTKNNKVGDHITLETKDHVQVTIDLSFLVDFEGERSEWFNVENYTKFLTDHVRSVLMGTIKRYPVAQFYLQSVEIIRDAILGEKVEDEERIGMIFAENGMKIRDVDIREVNIMDLDIRKMLDREQHEVVANNIQLDRHRRALAFTQEEQDIDRKIKLERDQTAAFNHKLEVEESLRQLSLIVQKLNNEAKKHEVRKQAIEIAAAADMTEHEASLARKHATDAQEQSVLDREQARKIDLLREEADQVVKRLSTFGPSFSEALTTIANNETAEKVAKALSVQTMLGGKDAVDVFTQAFRGIPGLEAFMRQRGLPAPTNGTKKTDRAPLSK